MADGPGLSPTVLSEDMTVSARPRLHSIKSTIVIELPREVFAAARQNPDIDADGSKLHAPLRKDWIRRQYADRFAAFADATDRVFNDGDALRVAGVSGMVQARSEIGRPDKHSINPRNGGDSLQLRKSFGRLDLLEQTEFIGGALRIIPDPAKSSGARDTGDAPHTVRRIAHRRDRPFRFFHALHIGQGQHLRADVEEALDPDRVVTRRPIHRPTSVY